MSEAFTLRVKRIYSQNPRGYGGAIFAGWQIDSAGCLLDASSLFVVRASAWVLAGVKVEQGQWWQVSGQLRSRPLEMNGYRVLEKQLVATEATLLRPSGEHIVSLIAESAAFEGIGYVKARRLWEAFGERLYQFLDEGNIDALSAQLTPESARKAIAAWSSYGDTRTLKWLQAHGFDVAIGRKIIAFFGAEAPARIEEDPYRLLSFCATWKQVDELARTKFSVGLHDPRRLNGAIEESCYRLFAEGHTLLQVSDLTSALLAVVAANDRETTHHWSALVSKSLNAGINNGSFVIACNGVQPLGAKVMENMVARALSERIDRCGAARLLSVEAVDRLICVHEAREGITLNGEQRAAIHLPCAHAFVCITGGAGVGKTTVLKALYEVYDAAGIQVVQMALAGRAAKRMHEATGRSASTIATFLRTFKEDDLASPAVLVIDEASMIDIISMSRICELLPPHVRLLLVGDPHQLMPVGPGLVLHTVVSVPEVPTVELKVVKRHGDGIRNVAAHIRKGQWPLLRDEPSADVAFLPCETDEATLAEVVFSLYQQDPENTQILSSHRRGVGGTQGINSVCQARLSSHREALTVWNDMHNRREHTGLHLGDLVLCTRNFWDRDLQNGSLGRIVALGDDPPPPELALRSDADPRLGWVHWDDGQYRSLSDDMLDYLELGYAITVHKAQGSQWPRVVVPVVRHRMLDRTLLYTAITRAQKQVLLVGDSAAARAAVLGRPRAEARQVGLDATLAELLASSVAVPAASHH